jgi:RNA 2',3'-cyclic 3'-phosphodiesterase
VATNGERERLRLFVALDLPQDVREALLAWRSGVVRRIPELRLVAQDALHATLCFLGSRPAREVEPIAAACQTALGGASGPELGLGAGLWLPPRRPRVLGVRLDDSSGALAHIQDAVCTALSDGGWYKPEKRPFLAHVTVARVPARARVRAIELPPLQSLRFRAMAVTLYRSRLQRSGARYEPLASVVLNCGGRAA